jgi:hypothetical protein
MAASTRAHTDTIDDDTACSACVELAAEVDRLQALLTGIGATAIGGLASSIDVRPGPPSAAPRSARSPRARWPWHRRG